MSEVRHKIQYQLSKFGEVSKQELYDVCAKNYYNNGMKHFGEILSRMVKSGDIERVKKGWYSLPKPKPIDYLPIFEKGGE